MKFSEKRVVVVVVICACVDVGNYVRYACEDSAERMIVEERRSFFNASRGGVSSCSDL